jgi:membrane fusion protein, heavy metal efflux system
MNALIPFLLLVMTLPVVASDVIPFNEQQREAMRIETALVQAAASSSSANLPGKVVVPNAQLHIVTAPQKGLVENLLAAEGESVRQGEAMARIQSPALLELQSEYLEVYTRYHLAKSNYHRDLKLKNEGIIANRRLLESKAQHEELLTSLSRVERMLELTGMDEPSLANLRSSRKLDSTLVISAPFDGVVLEQMTTAGNRVDAADPLYRIASLKPLWLEIHAPLEQIADIHNGQRVNVPAAGISGTVITVGKMVHGADQGVLVRAEVIDGAEKLRPGQFLQVQLAIASGHNNFRVPRSAVIYSDGKSHVFSAHTHGFIPIPVKILGEEASALIIQADITAKTRVAVSGTAAIKAAWQGGE